MPLEEITIHVSNSGTRSELRERVVNIFLRENSGEGGGDLASKYVYYVEKLSDERRIYLTRPATLKKGFDFLIHVENVNFADKGKYRDFPKHSDIVYDLTLKSEKDAENFERLMNAIIEVFQCNEINDLTLRTIEYKIGYSPEMVVKVLKWLFIEQDIRDWNYSGRKMLFNALSKLH